MISIRIDGINRVSLMQAEREVLRKALRKFKWDVPAAASTLGLGTSTLYRKMQELGIETRRGTQR